MALDFALKEFPCSNFDHSTPNHIAHAGIATQGNSSVSHSSLANLTGAHLTYVFTKVRPPGARLIDVRWHLTRASYHLVLLVIYLTTTVDVKEKKN